MKAFEAFHVGSTPTVPVFFWRHIMTEYLQVEITAQEVSVWDELLDNPQFTAKYALCDFCYTLEPGMYLILPWLVDKQATNVHCRIVTTCPLHHHLILENVHTTLTDGLKKGGPISQDTI